MKKHIIVREYATLRIAKDPKAQSLDEAEISQQDFDYLYELIHQDLSEVESCKKIFQLSSRTTLRAQNFVGVIETPSSTVIELLPKIAQLDDLDRLKEKLLEMILITQNIKYRKVDEASLKSYKGPLNEYLARAFILELQRLLQKGIRQDYLNVEDEQLYLRGKLNLKKHVQHSAGKSHIFPIHHDVLAVNNAENRLLKTAIEFILSKTKDSFNKKNALIFSHLMHEIPLSKQLDVDLLKWRSGRLVAHYQLIKPWCQLILKQKNPVAIFGQDRGYSLLFPMEKLFEQYIGHKLKIWLNTECTLYTQFNENFLLKKNNKTYCRLKPDFLIKRNKTNELVLDAKWKRLDTNKKQFGVSEADVYQMYAYSHIYLQHTKNVVLIYPRQENFIKAIEGLKFCSNKKLKVYSVLPIKHNQNKNRLAMPKRKSEPELWIVPYDLNSDQLCVSWEGKTKFLSQFFNI